MLLTITGVDTAISGALTGLGSQLGLIAIVGLGVAVIPFAYRIGWGVVRRMIGR